MPMYNLIDYSDNYSESLWGFKREEIADYANVANNNNAPSFNYKANLIGNTEADWTEKGVKIAVPLKHLSKFWKSLAMSLRNCKDELSSGWIEGCLLTNAEIGADANATGAHISTLKIVVAI